MFEDSSSKSQSMKTKILYGTVETNRRVSASCLRKQFLNYTLSRVGIVVFICLVCGGVASLLITTRAPFINPGLKIQSDNTEGLVSMLHHQETFVFTQGKNTLYSKCEQKWFDQTLNHFEPDEEERKIGKFKQRFFICSESWRNTLENKTGPIFFYAGNEANVELYLNNTGLMWENANEFGALLVFAEHRYFGKSLPFSSKELIENKQRMKYLSSEQALADYAVLIRHLKLMHDAFDSPVIAFGGSYGGMLASWFRMKYPHVVDGAIAASAPILAFPGERPPVDPYAFSMVTTRDAGVYGGSSPNCASNIREAWKHLFHAGKSKEGRKILSKAFALCKNQILKSEEDVMALANWAKSAYDSMAMGSYPYPSSYMLNGDSFLPAYPVREACSHISDTYPSDMPSVSLLEALRKSIGVYYNNTGKSHCYSLELPNKETKESDDFWGYLACTEMCMPFSTDGIRDMFYKDTQDWKDQTKTCMSQWNVMPRLDWATTMYGGRKALRTTSNIVFSNGEYDPWSSFGVLSNISDSVIAIKIEGGGHHVDLFFNNPLDTESIRSARATEKEFMWKWVQESYSS